MPFIESIVLKTNDVSSDPVQVFTPDGRSYLLSAELYNAVFESSTYVPPGIYDGITVADPAQAPGSMGLDVAGADGSTSSGELSDGSTALADEGSTTGEPATAPSAEQGTGEDTTSDAGAADAEGTCQGETQETPADASEGTNVTASTEGTTTEGVTLTGAEVDEIHAAKTLEEAEAALDKDIAQHHGTEEN